MKHVLITGGSRGIGASAALHCAQRGMGVILTYNAQPHAAQQVVERIQAEGGTAVALQLDVGNTASFAAFAAKVKDTLQGTWGASALGGLVNNAGFGLFNPIETVTEEQFDSLFNVHLKGPFFLTQALLPLIADGGRILNVSSGLARFALPGYAAYATMKGGIEVLTRYLAKELGERGISVNTLAPGAIETDFGGGTVRDNAQVNAWIASQTALGRVGLPDDIGAVVAALLGPGTGWINAQRVEASGGMML